MRVISMRQARPFYRLILSISGLLFPMAQAPAEPVVMGQDKRPSIRGQLLARISTTLSSEIPGKISKISIKDGDRFKSGDPLIVLDCRVQQAQHDEAAASLGAASATLRVNRRLRQLNSAGNLEIALAEAEEAKAQARVDAAKALLSKCQIDAPFNGKVADLKVQPLQYVQAGQAMLDLVDDSSFEVELIAPSRWLKLIGREQAFEITIDENERTYRAKVVRIGGRVDAVSETIKLYGELVETSSDLVPGMSGTVVFK